MVYTTSMTVVRETYDRCKASRNILQNHMVRYEERDLYMSQELQRELRERLDTDHHILLPQIFIDGLHLGVGMLCMMCVRVRACVCVCVRVCVCRERVIKWR